jgi:8-oxo-dGTP pyrophosphatase MutT (NUDIX family)/phosphohistidine phosphatase SixA
MASKDQPACDSDQVSSSEVTAAGAVVLRKADGGEVLLVHRPKYDDWSFAKGKQDPGEHIAVTAVREVLEETGVEIRLDRPLAPQLYAVSGSRLKTVHYWVGRVLGEDDVSGYVPNEEVDELGWFSFDKARARLTYADDVDLLEQVEEGPKRTSTLVVLRHARATKRGTWRGPDDKRPLTAIGRVQGSSLVPVLSAYGITRVVSSDSLRCLKTVLPYAKDQVLDVEVVPGINEAEASRRTVAATMRSLLENKENAVLCSHRPVLPLVFAAMGIAEEPLRPGEMVVCHHRKGHVVATERYLVR